MPFQEKKKLYMDVVFLVLDLFPTESNYPTSCFVKGG